MNNFILFQDGLTLFFGKYFIETRFAIVLLLVLIATVYDLLSHRIPNWLVLLGIVAGIAYDMVSPYGLSIFSSAAGIAIGFAAFIPLYALKAMGAGDVKLMAMVGTFLGPLPVLGAVLMTFIAGGVLAIAVSIRNQAIPVLAANLRFMLTDMSMKVMNGSAIRLENPPVSAGKMPYALAIAVGTATQIFLMHSGKALLS
jgi:prepilin peptidase CpaA